MKLKIDEIVKACKASVIKNGSDEVVLNVSTDTRSIKKGDLFVGIKGPHFNGNLFADEAIKAGAVGVVVDENVSVKSLGWVLKVEDSVAALGEIAKTWRNKIKTTVVAVTGSNGKSTTKEMIYAAISSKKKVIKTEGNFNNLIGLPLQVIRLDKDVDVAVFEMGMNAPGEIRSLAKIADPDIGLITNVNPAHLEKLHTIENVAKAKGELFEVLKSSGTAIINAEDPWVVKIGNSFKGRKLTFGMQNNVTVQFGRMISEGLNDAQLTFYVEGKEYHVTLPVPGTHNVMNALAAVTVGLALGLKVEDMLEGLSHFKPMKMRMERVQLLNGVQVINDCYNANPSSMFAALRTVSAAKRAGRFIAVLGDMLELGDASKEKHQELGKNAADFKVDRLFIAGENSSYVADGALNGGLDSSKVETSTVEEIEKKLMSEIKAGDIVLVKGSRGMKMERIVEYLKDRVGI